MGLYEASPIQSFGTGMIEGATATREKFRQEQLDKDKQALDVYAKLLESGNWDIVDPEKGSPNGQVFKVGSAGFLTPKPVSKYDIEKMRLDKELEIAKIQEKVQNAVLQGHMDANVAQKETARLNQLAKADDVKLGELRLAITKTEQAISSNRLMHEQKQALITALKPEKIFVTDKNGNYFETSVVPELDPKTSIPTGRYKWMDIVEGPNVSGSPTQPPKSSGFTVGRPGVDTRLTSEQKIRMDEADQKIYSDRYKELYPPKGQNRPKPERIPGILDDMNRHSNQRNVFISTGGRDVESVPIPAVNFGDGEPKVAEARQIYAFAQNLGMTPVEFVYMAYRSIRNKAIASGNAAEAASTLEIMRKLAEDPGMKRYKEEITRLVREKPAPPPMTIPTEQPNKPPVNRTKMTLDQMPWMHGFNKEQPES